MTFVGSMSGSSGSSGGYSIPQNTNSIQGLASGMNTTKIVDGLVQAAQAPLVQLMQQRQVLKWKSEQYQQVNTALTNLQSSLSNMRLQSTFLPQQVSSTNSSAVTGSTNGLAAKGTYSVNVSQLATGATISSSQSMSINSKYGSTTLANLPGNPLGSYSSSPFTVKVNGQSVTIDPSTDTVNSVLQQISADTATGVSAFYDPNSGKTVMQTTATGSSANIQLSTDAASNQFFQKVLGLSQPQPSTLTSSAFSSNVLSKGGVVEINGQKVSFTAGESITSAASAITTAAKSEGVTASANTTTGTITLSDPGLYSPLNISDPNGILGLPAATVPSGDTASQNAKYSVDGVTSSSSNNTPVFNGVTLDLHGTTNGTPASLTVSSNTKQVVQSITNFVKTYNQTLQTMQGLYNQKRNYSYKPLTSAQESQMTSTQIDEWNQKAQAGMLSYDPTLGTAMNNIKDATTTSLTGLTNNGSIQSLADIGITPINPMNGIASGNLAPGVTTTGWSTYGLLQINTAKLTQALQTNPQEVMNVFTNSSSSSSQEGIAKQLYSSVTSAITQISQEAGTTRVPLPTTPNSNTGQILLPSTPIDPNANLSTVFGGDAYNTSFIGQQISSIDKRAEGIQKTINTKRTMWQNQFAKMEQTIQTLNSQQSQLIGMLS